MFLYVDLPSELWVIPSEYLTVSIHYILLIHSQKNRFIMYMPSTFWNYIQHGSAYHCINTFVKLCISLR